MELPSNLETCEFKVRRGTVEGKTLLSSETSLMQGLTAPGGSAQCPQCVKVYPDGGVEWQDGENHWIEVSLISRRAPHDSRLPSGRCILGGHAQIAAFSPLVVTFCLESVCSSSAHLQVPGPDACASVQCFWGSEDIKVEVLKVPHPRRATPARLPA